MSSEEILLLCRKADAALALTLKNVHLCGSKPMLLKCYHFGVGAPPILVYISGDWDVHWGYGILTHAHIPGIFELSQSHRMLACPRIVRAPSEDGAV